ncbi:MAG: ATP-binding protein [Steroidobacteraceae bacterium]
MHARHFDNETTRIAALLIGLFAAAALLLALSAYWIADRAMRAELGDFISAEAGAVESGYRSEGLSEATEVVGQLTAVPNVSGRLLLMSPGGRKLAGNLDPMPPLLGSFELAAREASGVGAVREADGARSGARASHIVIGEGRRLPDGAYLFVGENAEPLTRTRARLLAAFAWIIGITVALAAAAGIFLSRSFLGRIDAITRTCRAIIAGKFNERIPVHHSQAQLDRLAATLNDMLDRIAALLESLRQVSSDIAHDLRTPLTRLKQRLESARSRSTSVEQYESAVDGALAECDAILAVFAALLRISQIESGMRLASFAAVDLSGLLGQVAEIFAPVAEDGGQMLSTDLAPRVSVHADQTLLLQMFSNLVENAIRHAGPHASIAIRCEVFAGGTLVRIVDSGPGIPAAERDKVFGRLYRLERSRSTPGNGLGLALVAAIARLHQYTIALTDAEPGLCVNVHIPSTG